MFRVMDRKPTIGDEPAPAADGSWGKETEMTAVKSAAGRGLL
jgi:hypothetical protein